MFKILIFRTVANFGNLYLEPTTQNIQLVENDYIHLKMTGSKTQKEFKHGFIAQEVKKIMEEKKLEFGGLNDLNKTGGKDILYIGYTEFIAPMVKAIQEQNIIIEAQKSRIETLEKQMIEIFKNK